MVKIPPSAPNSENLNCEDDTKPLNPNELLLSMFQDTAPDEENTEASPIESTNSEDLAQSLLKNLLNQPPINPNWKPKLDENQKTLHRVPSQVRPHPAVIRPPKPSLLRQSLKLQLPPSAKKPHLHVAHSVRPGGSLFDQSRPSAASFLHQHPKPEKTEASLSQLNPTLASALSSVLASIPTSSNSPVDSVLSRKLSGPVRLESTVVPFNVQRSQQYRSHELPSSHVVSYNGSRQEVPNEIRCHLCDYPMKMCYRKSKYKSEIREYPAYRCLRKGCQTFRAIRKVIDPDPDPQFWKTHYAMADFPTGDEALRSILSQPVASCGPEAKKHKREQMGTLVYVPAVLNPSQVLKLQQAAFDILSPGCDYYTAPLMSPTTMSSEEVKSKLCTSEGRSEIIDEILSGEQVSREDFLSIINLSRDPPEEMPALEAANPMGSTTPDDI